MSGMAEVHRRTIELWREGGQWGIRKALNYLEGFGMTEKEARTNLLGAIEIYNGTYPGGPNDPNSRERPAVDRQELGRPHQAHQSRRPH